MPRHTRLEVAGGLFHVTTRAVTRTPLFWDDFDRQRFLTIVERTVSFFGWRCHVFCLMLNHYHLLVETPDENLGRGMRHLNGSYAQGFNERHDRVGHLFGARYRATLVERETHLLESSRYIVLNPVRAGLCRDAVEWPWSSYRATAGLAAAPPFLSIADTLACFATASRSRIDAYREFIASAALSGMSRDLVPVHGRLGHAGGPGPPTWPLGQNAWSARHG